MIAQVAMILAMSAVSANPLPVKPLAVVLHCDVTADGYAKNCKIVSEDQNDRDLGKNALLIADAFRPNENGLLVIRFRPIVVANNQLIEVNQ